MSGDDSNKNTNGDTDTEQRPSKRFRSESIDKQKSSNDKDDTCNDGKITATSANSTTTNLSEMISSNVLQNVDELAKSYQSNTKPYHHGFVEDIFVDGFLGKFVLCYLYHT